MLKLPCELASYLERAEFPKRGLLKSPVYLLAARYGLFTCPSVRPNLPCVWQLRRISYGSVVDVLKLLRLDGALFYNGEFSVP